MQKLLLHGDILRMDLLWLHSPEMKEITCSMNLNIISIVWHGIMLMNCFIVVKRMDRLIFGI